MGDELTCLHFAHVIPVAIDERSDNVEEDEIACLPTQCRTHFRGSQTAATKEGVHRISDAADTSP